MIQDDQFGPGWEIRQIKENTAARSFWRKVIEEYTGGNFKEFPTGMGDWIGPIQTFEKK